MSAAPSAIHDSPLRANGSAPVVIPASRRLYWLLRRELWESRSIYMAPLAVGALIVAGFVISLTHLPGKMRAGAALNPEQQHALIMQPYMVAAGLLMVTTLLVAIFYCLDALYGERRDRSILFWKSLPVSDWLTVLSKASIPILVLPLVTFAITAVVQWLMLLVSSVALLGSGLSVATLWTQVPLFQMWVMLLYHLVGIHGLWYAPIFGYLLLVSGWARRAAFLWAALPLIAIGVVEKIAFNTTHFGAMLVNRLGGGSEGAAFTLGSMSMSPLMQVSPWRLLGSTGLWMGLIFTAGFLAAAVRVRRDRGPI